MQELLTHPAFQSAVAPLVCGLVVAMMLRRFGVMWQGFAIIAGLIVVVWLTIGLSFVPIDNTRKIFLAGLLLPISSFLLARYAWPGVYRAVFLAMMTAVVALWVVWPVLDRQEGLEAWMTGGKVALYAALVTGLLSWFGRGDLAKAGGGLLALGMGTGISAFIASSALYGQLAFSITAALGGFLLVVLILPTNKGMEKGIGGVALFAAAIPLALIGGASTVYAKLPPMALLFLGLVPMFAALPIEKRVQLRNSWIQGSVAVVLGLLPAIPAIWLAWQASEPMSY